MTRSSHSFEDDPRTIVPPPPGRMPRHVEVALRRALSVVPSDRWPSMTELLDQLARDPMRTRYLALVSVVGVLALLGGGFVIARGTQDRADPAIAAQYKGRLEDMLSERLQLAFDGTPIAIRWTTLEVVPERFGLKLSFALGPRPGRLDIRAVIFPYDPIHQTFVNIYEDGALRQQAILTADAPTLRFFAGTTQGRWSVIRTFVGSGIEHILIGPDHVLFLIGLLLPGGTLRRLALIVTAWLTRRVLGSPAVEEPEADVVPEPVAA